MAMMKTASKPEARKRMIEVTLSAGKPIDEKALESQFRAGKLTFAELQAALQQPTRGLTGAVLETGTVAVYGLNARFPVSLYPSQWERLLASADAIRALIAKGIKAGHCSMEKVAKATDE